MKTTILAGVTLGGLSAPAIIAVLLAVDPIGEVRPWLGTAAALPAAVGRAPVAPTPEAPTASRSTPPSSADGITPKRPPASAEGRLDAGDAAAIVGKRFSGARVVEAELEREQGVLTWEITFLLNGAENEIRVDATTGTMSHHEAADAGHVG